MRGTTVLVVLKGLAYETVELMVNLELRASSTLPSGSGVPVRRGWGDRLQATLHD